VDLQNRLTKRALRPYLPRLTVRLRLTLLYGFLFLLSGAGLLVITYVLVHNQLSSPLRTARGSLPPSARGGIVHSPATNSLRVQQASDLHQLLVQSAIALVIMAVVSIGLGWIVAGRVLRPLRAMTATAHHISERNLHERLALSGPGDELKDLGDTIDGLLARLEAAFDSQRRFVANASHELRTPLMLAQMLLQVALANPAISLDSLRATCEEVLETCAQQEQLIEALLTLARSQRGLDPSEPLDLADITDHLLHAHQSDTAAEGLLIDADLSAAPIVGDCRLIEMLVSNLLQNAVRHNVPGGNIWIRVDTHQSQTTLMVSNTGPFVPADQVERLLQPFQHLSGERTNDHKGLGLGLSIVAAIADAHGATLSAQPRPDGGLTVQVAFSEELQPGHLQVCATGIADSLAPDSRSRSRRGPNHVPAS
jgi:signal transduction histidine kinase